MRKCRTDETFTVTVRYRSCCFVYLLLFLIYDEDQEYTKVKAWLKQNQNAKSLANY